MYGTNAVAIVYVGGIYYSSFSPLSPPCLLSNTLVLLENNIEKPISKITASDKIISGFSKKPVKVKHCGYTMVSLATLSDTNLPYHIPVSHFSENVPSRSTYISGHHRIVTSTDERLLGVQVFKLVDKSHVMKNLDRLLEISGEQELRYYHVELEGGTNSMIANNMIVETLSKGEWNDQFVENNE
jgi:hypothetical protein